MAKGKMTMRQLIFKDPITIAPMATVIEAAKTMLDHKTSTLPVVELGKAVGVITESNLFRVLVDICIDEEQ